MMCAPTLSVSMLSADTWQLGSHALAHVGPIVGPDGWHTAWNLAAVPLGGLLLAGALYARGIWMRKKEQRRTRRWHAVAFVAGLSVLGMALVSPLDSISGELSSVHMVQHMLMMNVAAPLIVLGMPVHILVWNVALPRRRYFARWLYRFDHWSAGVLWHPIFVPVLYAGILWMWHVPALYQAALRSRALHDVEHLSFLFVALLFWRLLLDPLSQRRLNAGAAALCLFLTSVHATALGVLMTLSPRAWYDDYQGTTLAWGLQPLEDQQLAGLIMWMPGCVPYALAACGLLAIWLQKMSDRQDSVVGRAQLWSGNSQPAVSSSNQQRSRLTSGAV